MEFSRTMGCASHSDFQSEQDQIVHQTGSSVVRRKCDPKEVEQIRKQERDTVLELLDGLRKYANGEYKEADLSDNEHDLRIHLEYENRIWGIMKGLQQQAGEP
jgi:hypothetical protein